jgi:hypothetical protein
LKDKEDGKTMETTMNKTAQMYFDHCREMFGDRWEECIEQFPEDMRATVAGYVYEQSWYGGEKYTLLPSPEDFSHLECGEWESFEEYAIEQLQDVGISPDALTYIEPYFNMEEYVSDLLEGYYVADTGNGTVWVYAVEW